MLGSQSAVSETLSHLLEHLQPGRASLNNNKSPLPAKLRPWCRHVTSTCYKQAHRVVPVWAGGVLHSRTRQCHVQLHVLVLYQLAQGWQRHVDDHSRVALHGALLEDGHHQDAWASQVGGKPDLVVQPLRLPGKELQPPSHKHGAACQV